MDAGVLVPPPQLLFSILDGSAPLIYSPNGEFQMSPGGPSGQRDVPPHGDTDSGGGGTSVSEEPTALQESTEQRATPSHQIQQPPESFTSSTPSPTRGRNPPLTTTTGSVDQLFSNQIPTLSPRSSLPLLRISTQTRSLSTLSWRPLSASTSVSLSPVPRNESVSVSTGSSTAPRSTNDCARHPGYPCSIPVASTSIGSSTAMPTARLVTVAPAFPANISSVGARPSSWYLAVIFGTIGGLALLLFSITVIAFIYRKAKRRRMAQCIDVPWASAPGDEEGHFLFGSSRSVITSGGQKDGQPRTTNRELGVPVRLGANESDYSLYNHPIPGSRLFFDDTLPPKSEKLNLGHQSQARPTNALRVLPSHLIDEELAARARQEDDAYSFSGRPAGLRRRSHGHLDGASEVNPYINPPSEALNSITNERSTRSAAPKQPLIDRLRNLGNQDKEAPTSWDRLPTPGRDQSKADGDPWASSFKASFLNAFSALASGLKSSGENGPDSDKLTQLPTRHRPSIRHGGMDPFPRRSSTKPPAWILHEKDDGTGTVQFLPSLEKCYDLGTPTPGKLLRSQSFGRGRTSPPLNDGKGDIRRNERLIYPKAPILPPTAVYPHRPKRTPSLAKRNPISRDSSFYSTSSVATSKCDTPTAPGRLEDIRALGRHSSPHGDLDVVVLEPDTL